MANKKKLKEKVKKLRQKIKTVGDPKITGVSRPKKQKEGHGDDRRRDRVAGVGPRGGRYKVTKEGKRSYIKKSEVQEMIQEVADEGKFMDFVEKFKKRVDNK